MKLGTAIQIACGIRETLRPMCDEIAIAGSIRRRRPEVGDIDLVILAKEGQVPAIQQRCLKRGKLLRDGGQNYIFTLEYKQGEPPVQVDLFFARRPTAELFNAVPTNYGSLLLCRTGSKEHNIFLIEAAKKMGKRWQPYEGVYSGGRWELAGGETMEYQGGSLESGTTEEEIFKALGLDLVRPEQREI